MKTAVLSFITLSSLLCIPLINADRFGETVLGTAIGSTIGTTLGNVITAPRRQPCRREVRETVIVKEVPVEFSRCRRIERIEREYRIKLDELYANKRAVERRLKALEQELSDIEDAIDANQQALKRFEEKRAAKCGATEREIAEIKVK